MRSYLWETYHRLINGLDITSYRFLYDGFNLNTRMTGLVGPSRCPGNPYEAWMALLLNMFKSNR